MISIHHIRLQLLDPRCHTPFKDLLNAQTRRLLEPLIPNIPLQQSTTQHPNPKQNDRLQVLLLSIMGPKLWNNVLTSSEPSQATLRISEGGHPE